MFVVQFEKSHEQPSMNLFERPGTQVQVPTSRFWHQFQQPFCVDPQLTVILTFRKGKATHLIRSLISNTKTSFSTSALGACLGSSCEYPRQSVDGEGSCQDSPTRTEI